MNSWEYFRELWRLIRNRHDNPVYTHLASPGKAGWFLILLQVSAAFAVLGFLLYKRGTFDYTSDKLHVFEAASIESAAAISYLLPWVLAPLNVMLLFPRHLASLRTLEEISLTCFLPRECAFAAYAKAAAASSILPATGCCIMAATSLFAGTANWRYVVFHSAGIACALATALCVAIRCHLRFPGRPATGLVVSIAACIASAWWMYHGAIFFLLLWALAFYDGPRDVMASHQQNWDRLDSFGVMSPLLAVAALLVVCMIRRAGADAGALLMAPLREGRPTVRERLQVFTRSLAPPRLLSLCRHMPRLRQREAIAAFLTGGLPVALAYCWWAAGDLARSRLGSEDGLEALMAVAPAMWAVSALVVAGVRLRKERTTPNAGGGHYGDLARPMLASALFGPCCIYLAAWSLSIYVPRWGWEAWDVAIVAISSPPVIAVPALATVAWVLGGREPGRRLCVALAVWIAVALHQFVGMLDGIRWFSATGLAGPLATTWLGITLLPDALRAYRRRRGAPSV